MKLMKFMWKNFEPQMRFDDGRCENIMGREMTMRIGEKKCIGYRKGGALHECPFNATTTEYYCNHCGIEDDFFLCVKCQGECINRKRRNECKEEKYFIYLAAFDQLIKIGITQQYRFLERLVEQGADFAAKIGDVKDGKDARLVEKRISEELAITDRVIGKEKNSLLFADPNAAIRNIFSTISNIQGNGFSKYLISPEIYDFRRYYRLENVTVKPYYKELRNGLIIRGRVVAAKGNLIIFNHDKSFFSVNTHRLVGREISELKIK